MSMDPIDEPLAPDHPEEPLDEPLPWPGEW